MSRKHLRTVLMTTVIGWRGIAVAAVACTSGDSGAETESPVPSATTPTSSRATSATEPASGDMLPAKVLDLSNWKLTLPSGPPEDATEIEQPKLATFKNTYFHVDAQDDGVVFTAPAGGSTTSGSEYPRSELREMTHDGRSEASWSNRSGKHVMKVTQAITAVPRAKPHVVAGQIHDAEDDVVMVRLEGKRLFVEADGDEVGTLDPNYVLGTKFTVTITATPKGIDTTYKGRTVSYDKVGSGFYFKAGCYTQSNSETGDAPDAAGTVVIYDLTVSHS
jgi:hypothetical protein